MSKELVAVLKITLANTYAMAGKAQSFHWNVEGPNFTEYHNFFGSIYTDAYGVVDTLAEYIRIRGEYAPLSIPDILKAQTTKDESKLVDTKQMFASIAEDNQTMIDSYNKLFTVATSAKDQAIADFAAQRLDVVTKQAWFIRSYQKGM